MEMAGLALSIAALADTAAKLVEYFHDVKDGGKARIRLSAEISALWLVLENVKEQVEGWSSTPDQTSRRYIEALSEPGGALDQCSDMLNKLYDRCRPRSGARGVVQNLKWAFDKDEVPQILEPVHRLTTSINLAYAQTTLALLESVANVSAKTYAAIDNQERQALLDWISPINFAAQQAQMFSKWCPGTVTWYLKTPEYRIWLEGHNPLLWTPGLAGMGKSILASLVINNLSSTETTMKSAVLGVYFNSRVAGDDNDLITEILASLLKQLVAKLGLGDKLKQTYREAAALKKTMSLPEILNYVDESLQPLDRAFIIADGIDELPTQRLRAAFFRQLRSLRSISKISIMLISRPDMEIRRLLAPLVHICDVCDKEREPKLYHCGDHDDGGYDICTSCHARGITQCPNTEHSEPVLLESCVTLHFEPRVEDIERYIHSRLSEHEIWDKIQNRKDGLERELIYSVLGSAGGRFLMAKMYIDNLDSIDTIRDLRSSLVKPLGSLQNMYDKALGRLMQQRPDRLKMAKETLKLIMLTHQDLRAPELAQAVQYSLDPDNFDVEDTISASRLVELCSGILTFYYNGDVGFVHFSAVEYFVAVVDDWFPDCRNDVARGCLSFLLRDEFKQDWEQRLDNGSQSLMSLYPFHRHASRYWAIPLKVITPSETTYEMAIEFLQSEEHMRTARLSAPLRDVYPDVDGGTSALHMAVSSRVPELVDRLLLAATAQDLNIRDLQGRTPLHLAARHLHTSAANALLANGACPDPFDHQGFTPLMDAIVFEDIETVDALLFHRVGNSANVNLAMKSKTLVANLTPLLLAAERGNSSIVRILLRRPDLQLNSVVNGRTALDVCVTHGSIACVRSLVQDARCDVNSAKPGGFTPLQTAMSLNYLEIIELLLENPAVREHTDQYGCTPLMHATMLDKAEIVGCLLRNGCSILAEDIDGGSILHYAIATESGNVLTYLLDAQSSPVVHKLATSGEAEISGIEQILNKGDSLGNTPLLFALQRGYVQNAKLLLKHGADPDIPNVDGATPRDLARVVGIHTEIEWARDEDMDTC